MKPGTADVTEPVILTLQEYAVKMRDDWHEISQNFASQRIALDRLKLRVTLYETENGERRGTVKVVFSDEESVVIDARTTRG